MAYAKQLQGLSPSAWRLNVGLKVRPTEERTKGRGVGRIELGEHEL
jgi:hypothetical protein